MRETKELKEYQDEPSSQENLEKIPMLALKDIGKTPARLYIDEKRKMVSRLFTIICLPTELHIL